MKQSLNCVSCNLSGTREINMKIIVFLILLFSSALFAEEGINSLLFDISLETTLQSFENIQSTLKNMNSVSARQLCSQYLDSRIKNKPKIDKNTFQCIKKYNDLFKDNKLDVQIFQGYRDHLPDDEVVSGVERAAMLETLTKPCPVDKKYVQTCGFKRSDDDADLITKTIMGIDQKPKKIEIRITSPAYSMDDNENRSSDKQKILTAQTNKKFQNALINSDVVFYAGHSRKKGGPDFGPAERHLEEGEYHVNYDWYAQHRPGMKMMTEALAKRDPNKSLIYGMFSCDSKNGFSDDLKFSKNTGTILSNRVSENKESEKAIMTSLNSLFNFSCDSTMGLTDQPFTASDIF